MDPIIDKDLSQQGYSWVGFVVVIISALLGGGTFAKGIWDRFWGSRDKKKANEQTNVGKQIDDNASFRKDLMDRVDNLEGQVRQLQIENSGHAIDNARLTAENKYLVKDLTRQDSEIQASRVRNRDLEGKVAELLATVGRLEVRISELTGKPLEVALVDAKVPTTDEPENKQ